MRKRERKSTFLDYWDGERREVKFVALSPSKDVIGRQACMWGVGHLSDKSHF
jgi:hypothetical protein